MELNNLYNKDQITFTQAHNAILKRLVRVNPVLATAEWQCASSTDVSRQLIVMK